jgi:hypothetical protein
MKPKGRNEIKGKAKSNERKYTLESNSKFLGRAV